MSIKKIFLPVLAVLLVLAITFSFAYRSAAEPKGEIELIEVILLSGSTTIFIVSDENGVEQILVILRGHEAREIAKQMDGQTVFKYPERRLIIVLDLSVET